MAYRVISVRFRCEAPSLEEIPYGGWAEWDGAVWRIIGPCEE